MMPRLVPLLELVTFRKNSEILVVFLLVGNSPSVFFGNPPQAATPLPIAVGCLFLGPLLKTFPIRVELSIYFGLFLLPLVVLLLVGTSRSVLVLMVIEAAGSFYVAYPWS